MQKKRTVASLQKLTLTLSGMRGIEEYEIICSGDVCEIAAYTRFYTRDEGERVKDQSVTQPTDRILALLNECKVMSWDGFSGPNPRGVRDGWMFRLTAEVNGGQTIRADGSNNYPKHYHEFFRAIREMLAS